MRNIVLAFMLLFLSGCSLNHLLLSEEIDTVNVVKYQKYFKQHRAYFKRDNLQFVARHSKYLFLYRTKKKELGILLRRHNTYTLYNFTNPEKANITLRSKKALSYKKLLKHFSLTGYKPANLKHLGYSSKIALRRYKGVKTLMVEIKDYSTLKQKYEKAIRSYQSKGILSIKTHLPKKFIYPYFKKYQNKTQTPGKLEQLQRIGAKLHFRDKTLIVKEDLEEEVNEELDEEDKDENIYIPNSNNAKGYDYYLHKAPVNELKRYLAKINTRFALTYNEYQALQTHYNKRKEKTVFTEGSLEELIAAYKVNKDPKYKKRIMVLMKETQEENQ